MKSFLSESITYSLGPGVTLEDSITQEGFNSFSDFAGKRNASVLHMELPEELSEQKQFDESFPALVEELGDEMKSSLVLVVLQDESNKQQHGSGSTSRKLLASSTYNDRIALFYAEAQDYQLLLWTSIVLIFITYFVVAALFNMDYGTDDAGLYSRFKTDSGNDESKNQ